MYKIELDVDPVTLGFDPKEVKKLDDGTYVVERKQFVVVVWDPYNDDIGGEAWCPCSHEIFNGANWSHGGHYMVDGGDYQNYGRSRVIDYLTRKASWCYGVQLSEEEEKDILKTSALVCGHAPSRQMHYKDYIKQGYKCRLGNPPSDPYHDPFLPEKFKKMLGDAYVGDENV